MVVVVDNDELVDTVNNNVHVQATSYVGMALADKTLVVQSSKIQHAVHKESPACSATHLLVAVE